MGFGRCPSWIIGRERVNRGNLNEYLLIMKRKWIVTLLVCLILVCLGGSFVIYQLLMPVPFSVLRQIDEDLSTRLLITRVYSHSNTGVFAQLFQTNSEPYTYEIVEVVPIDQETVGVNLTNPEENRQLLCISVKVTYKISSGPVPLFMGRTIPETFYYIANKQDGKWEIFYMLKPSPNCS